MLIEAAADSDSDVLLHSQFAVDVTPRSVRYELIFERAMVVTFALQLLMSAEPDELSLIGV